MLGCVCVCVGVHTDTHIKLEMPSVHRIPLYCLKKKNKQP